MPIPESLRSNPWPNASWGPKDKPVCIIDGIVGRATDISRPLHGRAAYVVGINERTFPRLCESLEVQSLNFYEMRVADLQPLTRISGLRELAICWNTKVSDVGPMSRLPALEALRLEHTPRVSDLEPLASLQRLWFLEFSGGIWSKNIAVTLDPLAGLPLTELVLTNVGVRLDGLRPLARCKSLRSLTLSNQFPTDDYAFLSANLPDTHCSMFTAFVELGQEVGGKDVMVVGKGKPFLNRRRDREQLSKYQREFQAMREKYARAE